ncbi:hypothetical protein Tco_1004282 [Tanacetum coccineum]|uniref:Uncharacterized protein n=1 Tax=Tanacetum coccineum TaxID=301880 RepID=A0ABQ5FC29_9ASTR
MRMEQYLQCINYTIWEIVENGNAPIVTKFVDGKETVIPPTSVEEKAQRRAIENRFGGNTATKKTQKNLLKQQYENFAASITKNIAMLTMWERRFLKNTGKKLDMDNKERIRFKTSQSRGVFNFHKRYILQEVMALRNQDIEYRVPTIKEGLCQILSETTSNALASRCDGFGYDLSDQ